MEYDPNKPHLVNGDHTVMCLDPSTLNVVGHCHARLYFNGEWVGSVSVSWKGYTCLVLNDFKVSILAIVRDMRCVGHVMFTGAQGISTKNIRVDEAYICNSHGT